MAESVTWTLLGRFWTTPLSTEHNRTDKNRTETLQLTRGVPVRDEGQIRKILSYKALADKATFALRLSVTSAGAGRPQNFEVPVTPGEMEMLKVLAQVSGGPCAHTAWQNRQSM